MKTTLTTLVLLIVSTQVLATDPLFPETPPFIADTVINDGETGERLRREAEALTNPPRRPVAPPAFAQPVTGASQFRLQQQLRDLANYLREKEAQAEFEESAD